MRRAAALVALAAAVLGLLWFAQGTEPAAEAETVLRVADTPSGRGAEELVAASPVAGRSDGTPVEPEPEATGQTFIQEVRVRRQTSARTIEPAPGVRVRLAWSWAPDGVLFEGETGLDGVARAVLPGARSARSGLIGTIVEEGLVPYSASPAFKGRIFLRAVPGYALGGRVVDGDGRGVQASVRFRNSESSGDRLRIYSKPSAPDGRFLLPVFEKHIPEGVVTLSGRLVAEAGDAGTGVLEEQTWDMEDLPQDLEVVVRGTELRGRVVDGGGRPCAALPLRLQHECNFAEGEDILGLLRAYGRNQDFLEADGYFDVVVLTDAAGRFHARGIRAGRYRVFVADKVDRSREFWPELTRVPHDTADGPVEFVHDRPRFEVRLLSADGDPWTGPVHFAQARDHRRPDPTESSVRVRVVSARAYDGRILPASDDPTDIVAERGASGGVCRYDLPPGRDFLVVVEGGAGDERFVAEPRPVRIPVGESLVTATFRAQRGIELHEVRFDVTAVAWVFDPLPNIDGSPRSHGFTKREPVSGFDGHSTLVVEGLEHGVPVAVPWVDGTLWAVQLPVGRYRARLAWHERSRTRGDSLYTSMPHGGLVVPFEVTSEGAQTVRVEAGPGGILEVVNRTALGARLAVVDPEGLRRPLTRGEWSAQGRVLNAVDLYPAASTEHSEPVPAGPWRLVGTLGDRDIDRSIEVVDGEILRITLE